MNCNTEEEEEEDEYVGTPYGEFLESEEAYQEPSRSRWYLRLLYKIFHLEAFW